MSSRPPRRVRVRGTSSPARQMASFDAAQSFGLTLNIQAIEHALDDDLDDSEESPGPFVAKGRSQSVINQPETMATRVESDIYLSGSNVAGDCAALKRLGITHILNTAGRSFKNAFPSDFVYRTFHVRDCGDQDIARYIYLAFDFFELARAARGRILVHCMKGISRSASLVIAYLMNKRGTGFAETLQLLKILRPVVSPNPNFVFQLCEWERSRPSQVSRPVVYRVGAHKSGFPLPDATAAPHTRFLAGLQEVDEKDDTPSAGSTGSGFFGAAPGAAAAAAAAGGGGSSSSTPSAGTSPSHWGGSGGSGGSERKAGSSIGDSNGVLGCGYALGGGGEALPRGVVMLPVIVGPLVSLWRGMFSATPRSRTEPPPAAAALPGTYDKLCDPFVDVDSDRDVRALHSRCFLVVSDKEAFVWHTADASQRVKECAMQALKLLQRYERVSTQCRFVSEGREPRALWRALTDAASSNCFPSASISAAAATAAAATTTSATEQSSPSSSTTVSPSSRRRSRHAPAASTAATSASSASTSVVPAVSQGSANMVLPRPARLRAEGSGDTGVHVSPITTGVGSGEDDPFELARIRSASGMRRDSSSGSGSRSRLGSADFSSGSSASGGANGFVVSPLKTGGASKPGVFTAAAYRSLNPEEPAPSSSPRLSSSSSSTGLGASPSSSKLQ